MKARQLGMGMWGWMFAIGLGCAGVLLGAKLVPVYSDYFAIKKMMKATVQEAGNGSIPEVRDLFRRKMEAEYVKAISAQDLDVQKLGQGIKLSVTYESRVELVGNWTLVGDFHIEEKSNGAVD